MLIVWVLTALWTWTALEPAPAMIQYAVVIVIYPLFGRSWRACVRAIR